MGISVLLLAILVRTSYHEEKQDLALAKRHLLEGNWGESAKIYHSLDHSFWYATEARTGLALARALGTGPDAAGIHPPPELALHTFPTPLLLYQALLSGRFHACLRLAELIGREEPEARLFKAVALLELGETGRSLALSRTLPWRQKESWLGRRLSRVQKRLEPDPQILVYDRRGRSVGSFSRPDAFEADLTLGANLIPRTVLQHLGSTLSGRACRLSIDLELSTLAQRALEGYRGSIVLVSSQTGEVLVSISDPRTSRRTDVPGFQQLREPASISKLITATAALRKNLDVDQVISQMSCKGARRYEGGILYCASPAGHLAGLNHSMAVSCNIAFANLGIQLGREAMLEELSLFGFDRQPVSGMGFGRILARRGNQRQLADLSIGLRDTAITPLHAALVAAVFANKGVMPAPTLLFAQDGLLGLSPKPIPFPAGWEVIDPGSVTRIQESMKAVVQSGGTGHGLSPEDFAVAMKTGTGRNQNLGFHTNYVGIAPMPEPKIAFCIRITNQSTSGRVRRATFRVAEKLFQALSTNRSFLTSLGS
jgi:peptidoglycan glycosyltransferase